MAKSKKSEDANDERLTNSRDDDFMSKVRNRNRALSSGDARGAKPTAGSSRGKSKKGKD